MEDEIFLLYIIGTVVWFCYLSEQFFEELLAFKKVYAKTEISRNDLDKCCLVD